MRDALQNGSVFTLVLATVALGCAVGAPEPGGGTRASARQSIVAGRGSGGDENHAVAVTTRRSSTEDGHCSATLVAPRIAVTASHCLTDSSDTTVHCTSAGDGLTPETTALVPAGNVRVHFGADRASFVEARGMKLLVPNEQSICRNDIAVILLESPLSDIRLPVRPSAVRVGERISVSGWGYTADGQTQLPSARTSRDGLEVTDVGPGLIPAGSFAVPGASLCMGDSGAGAIIDGALVGVYSRIASGPYTMCELTQASNIFTMTGPNVPLLERAFAEIGEKVWYAGSPPPWLGEPGASCRADAECQSGACDLQALVCAAACGDAGAVCRADERCDPGTSRCVPRTGDGGPATTGDDPPASTGGCAVGGGLAASPPGAGALALGGLAAALLRRVGRRRGPERGERIAVSGRRVPAPGSRVVVGALRARRR